MNDPVAANRVSPPYSPPGDSRKRALLIGIRTYPQIPEQFGESLAGCHNDVAHMRDVLLAYGFADADVRVLVDRLDEGCDCPFCREDAPAPGTPNRDGIVEAVQDLIDATTADDLAVVYYSGHGSEFSGRGLFAGQRFQTIVPHDSGRGHNENRDIADREIEGWIRDFHEKTPYLTLIFDCCHSGGMADLRGAAAVGRRVKADDRTEAEAFAPGLRDALRADAESSRRGTTGWLRGSGPSAIILSACAAKELSSETAVDGKRQGLFTCQLTRTLRERGATSALTWADAFPKVADRVTQENLSQHPRREGNAPIFERGEIDPDDVYPPDVVELKKLAVVIGIDYKGQEAADGFPPLRTPKRDAEEIARVLADVQDYEIVGLGREGGPLKNEKATRRRIHEVIDRLVKVKARAARETAVVIYFAGHGVVRTGENGEQAGYLIPWEAAADDPSTWLPMKDLRDQLVEGIRDEERLERLEQDEPLARLTSRHLLLVLDCCFGGALSFDFFRGGDTPERPIYYSEYKRFVEGTAWQLLTSASYNQQAMDRNPKNPEEEHSPFARALIEGLTTEDADVRYGARSDQIVTAGELHQFVDARLKTMGVDIQTPGLMPLRPLVGQFIFYVPGFKPTPLPDPPLDPTANPWPGVGATIPEDLFCGREQATLDILEAFLALRDAPSSPLMVEGPSGSGKTALIQSGLLPLLAEPAAARQRLRSWLGRQEKKYYLVSRDDVKNVRQWAEELELDSVSPPCSPRGDSVPLGGFKGGKDALLDQSEALAAKIRDWAGKEGLLAEEESATEVQARMQMQSFGVPSFAGESGAEPEWMRRLGVLRFLDAPDELARRLRLWLAKHGLIDFMSVSDRAVAGLVGRWNVVKDVTAPPPESDPHGVLLVADGTAGLAGDAWETFAAHERTRTVVTVRGERSHEGLPTSTPASEFQVPLPSRAELRAVITGPASARVLFFEPPELVDELVEEVESSPTPLPLLSMALSHMYVQAWERRRDTDRQLTADDLSSAVIAGLLSAHAEAVCQRLVEADAGAEDVLRSLFKRLVGEELTPRLVGWRELELAHPDARRRLEEGILPVLREERVLVTGRAGVELVHAGLITAWERLARWTEGARRGPWHALWHRALEWEASGFDRGKLWGQDDAVRELFTATTLNRLERAFVIASELERRTIAVVTRAARAMAGLYDDWNHSAARAAEAGAIALETRGVVEDLLAELENDDDLVPAGAAARQIRDQCLLVARQALYDVLAATPFSVSLTVPPLPEGAKILGLGFSGDDALVLRFGHPDEDREADDFGYTWDLRAPARPGERLPAEAELPPRGRARSWPQQRDGFVSFLALPPGPAGPKAQPGYDKTVRYFDASFYLKPIESKPPGRPPRVLLGHRGMPYFVDFSSSYGWLSSAAELPSGAAEVRLWPLGDPSEQGGPLRLEHPLAFTGQDLGDVFVGAEPAATSWRIEDVAADGSSFALRAADGNRTWTLDLPPPLFSAEEISAEESFKPPPLPAIGPLPALPPPPRPHFRDAAPPPAPKFHGSPGGHWLGAVTENGARLWRLETPSGPQAVWTAPRASSLAWSPDGGHLAVGYFDGTVHLAPPAAFTDDAPHGPNQATVVLRCDPQAGLAVRGLAFDHEGRLAVERRAVYDPKTRRVDVYQLDLEVLIRLARGHAGHEDPELYLAALAKLDPRTQATTLQEET